MPNIRSQEITSTGVTIVASDGRSFSMTFVQVRAHFLTETGNAAARRSKTIAWLKGDIVAALGAEQVDALLVDLDIDDADGRLRHLRHGGPD